MAPYAVSITKSIQWRGQQENFSNVYHFDTQQPINTDAGWDSLIDQIVASEKTIHSNLVTFRIGRVWGPTNQGPAASETQRIKDLSGTGSMTVGVRIYSEAAVVAHFFVGRRAGTGRKRFLRKFFHSQGLPTSLAGADGSSGLTTIAAGDKTPYAAHMNLVKSIQVGGGGNNLCTPDGTNLPAGAAPVIL